MPANLPPQYYEKEKELKKAKTPEEKIVILKELLAIMPKHKGTDKLQAELRAKIAKLSKMKSKKSSVRKTPSPYEIKKEGAGQLVLFGPPNSGKSLILSSLTHAESPSPEYPFSTLKPIIGMMDYQDIQFQLIDTPSIDKEFLDKGLVHLLRQADLLLLVVDVGEDDVVEKIEAVRDKLKEKNFYLEEEKEKMMIIANKIDKTNAEERKAILEELYPFPIIPISAKEKKWNNLKEKIFENLKIIRVYLKPPGKPPSREEPVILKKGSKVIDAAEAIHKDFLNMRYARIWNDELHGLRVEREYLLKDGDILEFHL